MDCVKMECMCLECGISHYLPLTDLVMENVEGMERQLITNLTCTECGGPLMLVGKAGDHPYYRVG